MHTTTKAGNRILCLVLALCLLLGMTLYLPGPVTADAAGPYDDEFDFNSVSGITFALSHHGGNYLVHSNGTAQAKEIAVDPGVTVSITVHDVSADVGSINGSCAFSIGTGAKVYLTLEGDNEFRSGRDRAGLEVHENATLVITGDSTGALIAWGGDEGAGIGSATNQDSGAIVIEGGDVTAYGGYYAAGIGGGSKGSGGEIFISGGTVETHGGTTGAGIGSGSNASGSGSVVIEGGDVSAYGDQGGAGIGGGQNVRGDSIRISGGTVFAKGHFFGAGIGGGGGMGGGEGGTITIEGGHVTTAVDTDDAAGIGGGGAAVYAGNTGTVRISGGVVNTTRIGPGRSTGTPSWNGSSGSLVITGGSLYLDDSLMNDTPLNGMGETLHRAVLQVGDPPVGAADVTGGSVSTASYYGLRDVRTDSSSSVSFWLPAAADTNVQLTVGGLTYGETFQMLPDNSNTAVLTTSGVTGVAVDPDTAQLKRGEQQQFTATVSVVGGADRTVQWSVDGTDSSIDATGLLTVGVDEAADTLTVRAVSDFDPSAWGEAVVTVIEDGKPVSPSVSPTKLELDLQHNPTGTVVLRLGMSGDGVTPLATGATAVSADPAVAVAPEGILSGNVVITAYEVGKTPITFTFDDPGNTVVTVNVTVTDSGGTPAPGPTINPSAAIDNSTLRVGETATLRVSLGQSGGAPMATGANLSVDNKDVATVDQDTLTGDGDVIVTATGAGETAIRIAYEGVGGHDTSVRVKVGEGGTTPPVTPSVTASGGRSFSGGSSSPPANRAAKTRLPASAFFWDSERTLTIDYERITPLGLLSVQWDEVPLTRGAEYGVYSGSVIVRFDAAFLAAQSPGDHTVRVEFLNHTGETTVTVGDMAVSGNAGGDSGAAGNATHNPNTGGGRGGGIWAALLLGSLGAAALVSAGRDAVPSRMK